MIKNVVVTGYNGSGSSALKKLLSEYDECKTMKRDNFEHILFYTPNGLFDLENKLLLRNNQSRSDEALKSFEKEMYKLWKNDFIWCGGYKKQYDYQFKKIYEDFINDLTQFKISGSWSYDLIKNSFSFPKFCKDFLKSILGRYVYNFGKKVRNDNDNVINCSLVSDKEFYALARKFVNNYFNMINKGNDMFIYDHLLKPYDIGEIDKYFGEDFRMIIVERDVRDIYLYGKYIRYIESGSVSKYPKDVNQFIEFWKRLKAIEKKNYKNKKVLRINYEDLVYNYDKTISTIEKFLGLDPNKHNKKNLYFIKERAEKNIKIYLKNKEWLKEVEPIEKELSDYLYKGE